MASVKGDIASMKGDIASIRHDVDSLQNDVKTLRGDMEQGFAASHAEMQSMRNDMDHGFAVIRQEILSAKKSQVDANFENLAHTTRDLSKTIAEVVKTEVKDAIESVKAHFEVSVNDLRQHILYFSGLIAQYKCRWYVLMSTAVFDNGLLYVLLQHAVSQSSNQSS